MLRHDLKNLEKNIATEEFREAYVVFLKIFKEFETLIKNKQDLKYFLNILASNIGILIPSEKLKVLERSIENIYQRADIFPEPFSNKEKTNIFFKKQIKVILTREFSKLFSILPSLDYHENLIEILVFLIKNIQFMSKNVLIQISRYCLEESVSRELFFRLCNSIFDRHPKESLDFFMDQLKKDIFATTEREREKFKTLIYSILVKHVDIYPDLFAERIDFFLKELKGNLDRPLSYRKSVAQLVKIIAQDRSELLISVFYRLLNTLRDLSNFDFAEILHLIEFSLRKVYSNHSTQLFEELESIGDILNLMDEKLEVLNEFLYEFLIDYLEYRKIYQSQGKITQDLLESYLIILKFLHSHELRDEFFLFSILNQVNIKKLDFSHILKELQESESKNVTKLNQFYQELIDELDYYKNLIFGR
ncbi:MAG: hypothetical protein EU550_03270, partial [Promethearchaeota archaeon]